MFLFNKIWEYLLWHSSVWRESKGWGRKFISHMSIPGLWGADSRDRMGHGDIDHQMRPVSVCKGMGNRGSAEFTLEMASLLTLCSQPKSQNRASEGKPDLALD